ncbi:DUF192 domain-containing protein [Marivibrio halodurans]|uniref:DUF192 domain-containing protein n=1 Tax=Marivibrio halodurans TaxID=2039722 RepID=A0A8J7S5H7_9PROT|nr:DUF192 domain-containing protein [Marivibrio halodurans]MBP5855952.1 DUF192 domain-containing protein [Marivibrio halodurans]
MRRLIAAFLIVLCALPSLVLAQQEEERPDFATDTLAIETASGESHGFDIEIARTNAERGYGLMFVREMAPDRGMLFDYGREQRVSMWMRNTYVPLDMLFIEKDGEIESIIERAAPHTRTPRPSKGRVLAVLELKGGTAQRLGIEPGDRVLHAMFGTAVTD